VDQCLSDVLSLVLCHTECEFIDLGSSCGSKLNGRQVFRAKLRSGDVLELGQSLLIFQVLLPSICLRLWTVLYRFVVIFSLWLQLKRKPKFRLFGGS